MEIIFNRDLANRFVSDYKFPIPITSDKDLFFYYLSLFEEKYGTMTKYLELISLINDNFEGNPNKFLEEYYNVRENIIQSMLRNPFFINFNEKMDMNVFAIKDKPNNISSSNIYNCDNINKTFISIDLKKANFQSLRSVNPNIVLNALTYEDFIGLFTNLDYIKDSKYTRQVIFGKLNPKRHITVEKYLINEIRKYLDACFVNKYNLKLVSMSNDELVYEICVDNFERTFLYNAHIDNMIKEDIKEILNLDVSATIFSLIGYKLLSKSNDKVNKTFFVKKIHYTFEDKLVCVPQPFFPIVFRLINNMTPTQNDKLVEYEGCIAELKEDFYILEI